MLGIITYLTGRLVNSIKSSLPRPHPVGADNTTHHSRKADSLPFTAFGIIWKWQMQQCYNWASNFFNSSSSPNSFTNKLFLVPQFYLRRGRGRFLWNAKPLKKGEKKMEEGEGTKILLWIDWCGGFPKKDLKERQMNNVLPFTCEGGRHLGLRSLQLPS